MEDNKVRLVLIGHNPGGVSERRVLEMRNPGFYPFALEHEVTNGLGFNPIRKINLAKQKQVDTQLDLTRHLADMELMVKERNEVYSRAVITELFEKFVATDKSIPTIMKLCREIGDNYKKLADRYFELRDMYNEVIEAINNTHKQICGREENRPEALPHSTQREPFYRKARRAFTNFLRN